MQQGSMPHSAGHAGEADIALAMRPMFAFAKVSGLGVEATGKVKLAWHHVKLIRPARRRPGELPPRLKRYNRLIARHARRSRQFLPLSNVE